jgi:energy-coupling factor transporter ATP-binding protein EcfA2
MFKCGSEILRFDCHLHTKEDNEFKYDGDENWYVSNYVNKLKEEKIKVGVITNHNKFLLKEYKDISSYAMKNDIFLLPGVEISVKEGQNGVHALIIFKPQDWISNGKEYINQFLDASFKGITENREHENAKCNFDLNGLLKELESYNKEYFIVFAHVDQSSGFFKECKGGVIKTLSKNHAFKKRVLGFQKSRNINNYKNSKNWTGLELCKIEGSDPKSIKEIGKGKKSYIKIGDFKYEAVKYALLDHDNRVFENYPVYKHGHIKSISFEGGKFSGETICFNKELNCLIGIRGSGKSALLEAARYSLKKEPSEDKEYKDSLLEYSLGSGGTVSLRLIDQQGDEFQIRRILGEKESILNDRGKDVELSIDSIINNPLYFGQKDLSMTKNGYEFELLDKLVGRKTSATVRKLEDVNQKLCGEISKYYKLDILPDRIKELEQINKDAEHILKVYNKKGVEEKLNKMTGFQHDNESINNTVDLLEEYLDNYNEKKIQKLIKKNKSAKDYKSKYNEKLFEDINEIIDGINKELKNIEIAILNLEDSKKKMNEKIKILKEEEDGLKDEFAEIKRDMQEEDLNADIYLTKNKLILENNKKIEELKDKLDKKDLIATQIKKLFRERNEVLLDEFNIYKSEIKEINEVQDEISIEIEFKGNNENFKDSLKEKFKGSNITSAKYSKISEKFTDFADILMDFILYNGKDMSELLTEHEDRKVKEILTTNHKELLSIKTPNKVEIYYHDKPLSKHSAGQRASALVLFILSQQENDIIIIDQPEDDLDNQVIYREIIKSIKEKKSNIQFIFATHNANIPVLGDAENVIELKEINKKFKTFNGTIDNPDIQSKIVEIMEGGSEAFKRRNSIYSIWNRQI